MENVQTSKRKQRDILDLTKYILSIFIVAIHSSLLGDLIYPWVKIAVPLFFIISAYLLTEKLKETPKENRWTVTWKYIKRNLLLYLFWFVILLPVTIVARKDWWQGDVGLFIWRIISSTLFSSTFKVSWFIVGCIYGALAIYLTMKLPKVFSLIIGLAFYSLTLILSSYYFLLDGNIAFESFKYWYVFLFTSPEFSFPTAICWMLIGSFISRTNIALTEVWHYILAQALILISFAALYFEWMYIYQSIGVATIELSLLVVVCPLIFISIKDLNISLKHASTLRKLSTLIYLIHITTADMVRYFFALGNIDPYALGISVAVFFITLVISHGWSFLLLWIEKKKYFTWVRYSH